MKIRILLLALLVGMAMYGTPAMAALLNGSWSSTAGDFNANVWKDIWWGGTDFAPGNEFQARGDTSAQPQWVFAGGVISTVQNLGGGLYHTIYTHGTLDLYLGGPWNPGAPDGSTYTRITMTSLTKDTTKYFDGSLTFDFSGIGTIVGQTVTIAGHYNLATPLGPFTYLGTNPNTGFPGDTAPVYLALLTNASVTVAPVPIPGAVWLLSSGLIGLVGVRRRLRK